MNTKLFFIVVISMACLCSCSETSPKKTPEDVIKRYERLVLEMKADSIAQLFKIDAEVGHEGQPVVKGRDSIYSFLSKFKDVRVIKNHDEITSTSVRDDSAIIDGSYTQTVIINVGYGNGNEVVPGAPDTVDVGGKFTATMIRDKNKNWLISKMRTRSN